MCVSVLASQSIHPSIHIYTQYSVLFLIVAQKVKLYQLIPCLVSLSAVTAKGRILRQRVARVVIVRLCVQPAKHVCNNLYGFEKDSAGVET